MSWEVNQGDCIERMAEMEEGSVDAVVCDPPYGIDFMGKEWDSFSPARVAKHAESVKRKGTEKASERYADRFGQSQGGGVAIKYDESLSGNLRFQLWCEQWARECLRVLKPGGHLLACGGSRTHHRLVCGVEDAGFEIRDRIDTPTGAIVHTPDGTLAWMFGSGFPKGRDVHKALCAMGRKSCAEWLGSSYGSPAAEAHRDQIEAAVTELERPVEDAEWDGWNVALKPAHEPIVVARKPLIGTVAENVLEHGTGGLNIGDCRIEGVPPSVPQPDFDTASGRATRLDATARNGELSSAPARWPANVVLSHLEDCEQVGVKKVKGIVGGSRGESKSWEGGSVGSVDEPQGYADEDGTETVEAWNCAPGCPVAALDEQSGELKSGFMAAGTEREGIGYRGRLGNRVSNDTHGDSGGASRFFYCAKTSRAERNAGLEGFPDVAGGMRSESSGQHITRRAGDDPGPTKNNHPTVKPINLMRWLVRLVTPPGGTCLDPFLGSGSTGCAAVLEGFDFVGIERETDYIAIAEARIAFWAQHEGREVEDVLQLHAKSTRAAKEQADRGQGDLLALAVQDVISDIEQEEVALDG